MEIHGFNYLAGVSAAGTPKAPGFQASGAGPTGGICEICYRNAGAGREARLRTGESPTNAGNAGTPDTAGRPASRPERLRRPRRKAGLTTAA